MHVTTLHPFGHTGAKRSTSQRLEMTNLVETSGRPDAILHWAFLVRLESDWPHVEIRDA
jgi:hypothetical protein